MENKDVLNKTIRKVLLTKRIKDCFEDCEFLANNDFDCWEYGKEERIKINDSVNWTRWVWVYKVGTELNPRYAINSNVIEKTVTLEEFNNFDFVKLLREN